MALWGTSTSDEAKPKYLTADQKKNTFADQRGWVYKDPNTGLEEVLVAVGELAGTATNVRLGNATISSLTWVTTALAAADTAITVDVVYNEKVTVDTSGGTPTLVVTNDDVSLAGNGNYTLSYASGTGTNKLRFTATGLTLAATDSVTVAAQNIVLNGGTIVDTASATVNSGLAISGAAGSAIGPITITA